MGTHLAERWTPAGEGWSEPVGRRRTIQVFGVVTLALTVIYLTWRATATLNLSVWWVSIPLILLEVHAAIILGLHTFTLWRVDSLEPADPVSETPFRVAVFIPTYNEPTEVLLPTIASAVALEPAHETWVLDDGNRPWVHDLASSLGARYLARADNVDAKAGNLNNALDHIDVDLVAVLDADHVATPNLLRTTLGYFDDPAIALVQTPQAFYNAGSFEEIERRRHWWWPRVRQVYHEQELFYRIIQPGKNRWGAAFWCGTGAILRTSALRDVGGVATGTVTEDIQTTIRMHRRGWHTIYHNEVLARGLAAATAEQYVMQRHRWCTGAMQVLHREHPLTRPGLTLAQRLSYAATLFGWFDAWRTLGYILLPMAVIATGASPIVAHWRTFLIAFLALLIAQQVDLWLLGRGRSRPIASTIFELVRMTPALHATLSLVYRRRTEFRVTPKGRAGTERTRGRAPGLLVALLVISLATAVWYLATVAGLTPLTYGTPWVAHAAFAWLLVNGGLLAVAIARTLAERHAEERRASHRFALGGPVLLNGRPGTLINVSLTGARVEMDEAVAPPGVQVAPLALQLGDDVEEHACLMRMREPLDGRVQFGLEFVDETPVDRAVLALWAFRARPSDEPMTVSRWQALRERRKARAA